MEEEFNYVIGAPGYDKEPRVHVKYFYGREVQYGSLTDACLKLKSVQNRVNEDDKNGRLARWEPRAEHYSIWKLEKIDG